MEWGSQRQLANGWGIARCFCWALVSGGLQGLCGYSHLFLRCPGAQLAPVSRLVDEETEALGIKIVNQGLGGAQLGANLGVQGYVLS